MPRDATVTVRYYAGARAAAGTPAEQWSASSLADLLDQLDRQHGEPLRRILSSASFLVDGAARHDRSAPLAAGCTVDVLPPFAGG